MSACTVLLNFRQLQLLGSLPKQKLQHEIDEAESILSAAIDDVTSEAEAAMVRLTGKHSQVQ